MQIEMFDTHDYFYNLQDAIGQLEYWAELYRDHDTRLQEILDDVPDVRTRQDFERIRDRLLQYLGD